MRHRLLIVSDEMEVGGSQRQITHLMCGLDRAQWEPELLYFRRPSFLLDRIRAAGIGVHCISKEGALDARFLWRLIGLLRRGRYDVIHCFSLTAELWVSIAHRIASSGALILSMRDMGDGLTPRQWTIKRAVCRRADAIISNSERAAVRLDRELGGGHAIDVIPNGVESPRSLTQEQRTAVRAALPSSGAAVVALFVGRLAPQKNVTLLLEAMARLPQSERPFLLLAGSGPLADQLSERAGTLGIDDHVAFLGERSDVGDLMQAADLLVLPSHDEGMSNVVLEAMAAGCAVIASDVGGNPEVIVDGDSGLLFAAGDLGALTARLHDLVVDAELRARIGRSARARIADMYSIGEMVTRTTAVYRRVLAAMR